MRKEKRMRLQGKCADCPYAAGLIKCIVSPCIECRLNKRKTHPFSELKATKHL